MKKYIFIYRSEVMSNLQYVFNIVFGFIGYIIMIFVFLNFWNYIYDTPNALINGYTKSEMIWYVCITEVLLGVIKGRKLFNKIKEDVVGGNITYKINKPFSYIGYIFSCFLGESTIRAILYVPMAIVIGILFVGTIPLLNIAKILALAVSGSLAVIIGAFIIILIGLFSFNVENSEPIYWIYSKIVLILGTIFPVEYFPVFLQPIIKASPIFVTSYGPAKLFVDFKWETFISVLVAQIVYITIVYFLCVFTYNRGVRKLNVNGG